MSIPKQLARRGNELVEAILGYFNSISPLPEQQRIVGILDDVFSNIATAKANAERISKTPAPSLKATWTLSLLNVAKVVEKRLEELGTIIQQAHLQSEYVTSEFRSTAPKRLRNGKRQEITTELFISEARYKEIKANFGVPKQGDILLTAIAYWRNIRCRRR